MTAPEKRLTPVSMGLRLRRVVILEKAAELLGQERAAAAIGIKPRSLRAKLDITRGVRNHDLQAAATALDLHAATLVDHANTIRAVLAGGAGAA